jgi:hypothetical protein
VLGLAAPARCQRTQRLEVVERLVFVPNGPAEPVVGAETVVQMTLLNQVGSGGASGSNRD